MTNRRVRANDPRIGFETITLRTPLGARAVEGRRFEERSILELCCEPLSVAEIAAHLHLPIGVARVLIGDLAADGLLQLHLGLASPADDVQLIQRLIDGIRAL